MPRMNATRNIRRTKRPAVTDLMAALDRIIAAAREAERARNKIVRQQRKEARNAS